MKKQPDLTEQAKWDLKEMLAELVDAETAVLLDLTKEFELVKARKLGLGRR